MAEKAGMSTGTKIAMGVAGAVGAAVIGAATFGGGYVIYKNVKGKQQDASPLQLHILVKNAKNLKDEDTFGTDPKQPALPSRVAEAPSAQQKPCLELTLVAPYRRERPLCGRGGR
eukprot:TRINITY_DN278_c0_g1_i3.p1 TRINITY_DN278_c0_g1~~TRINITY_DN278_c0_g1_i3.p1  ORF type:complete len:135 (-),score=14.49 TRINITY_DN278_c0_g1_i3:915-1259(-)